MSGTARLLRFLYPVRCAACGAVIPPNDGGFCPACAADLAVPAAPLCPLCGQNRKQCTCGKGERYYVRCVAPFYYEGAARAAVIRLKSRRSRQAAQTLACYMFRTLQRRLPRVPFDAVVPLPLSRRRLKQRGYNQSQWLAELLAGLLGLPLLPALVRPDTAVEWQQKQLPAALRRGNLLGAFEVPEPQLVKGKVLLLVNDVITTGATFNECAKMLRLAGAKSVYCAAAATDTYKAEKDTHRKEKDSS
ncbi:MAG: ComF family protein [Clostridia bacterium]|nr:ComF family protein [Clostridia bacterium]